MSNIPSCIGINLSSTHISICITEKHLNQTQIKHIKQIALNKNCYVNNQYNCQELAKLIRKDLFAITNSNLVVMSIQNDESFVRCEKVPSKEKNITAYLEKKLKPLFPQVILDFYQTEKAHKNTQFLSICYAAISSETKKILEELASYLSLNLISIQHPSIAALKSLAFMQNKQNYVIYVIQFQNKFDIFILKGQQILFAYNFTHSFTTDNVQTFIKKTQMGIHAFYNMYPQHNSKMIGIFRLNTTDSRYQKSIFQALPDIDWQDNINNYLPSKKTSIQNSEILQNLSAVGCSLYHFINEKQLNIGQYSKPLNVGVSKKTKLLGSIATFTLATILLTSGWFLNKKNTVLEQDIAILKNSLPSLSFEQKNMIRIHEQLSRILQNHNKKTVSNVFDQLMAKSPSDISLTNIVLNTDKTITLSGVASKQESVILLYEELKKVFSNVSLKKLENTNASTNIQQNAFNIHFSILN